MLHGRLLQLGAKPFCERGEGNEQHPEGHSFGLREWVVLLRKQLLDRFPLPDGQMPIADDVFLVPKWKLALADSEPSMNGENGIHVLEADGTETCADAHKPSTELLPIKGSHTALLTRNERITPDDHFQDVRVLDLRLHQPYEYRPGAVAVIYPKNFPEDVKSFIDLMGWQEIADSPLNLVSSQESEPKSTFSTPSPLRHLSVSSTRLTLRWLFENVLDIMAIPRRSFFASLAHFASTESEDEQYQKERLLELANPELIDELWDYTTRPKRTILEVMMDFTTIKIPWEYALTALPLMKGRQFSIASGGALKMDGEGHSKVELLVAIANPPSPIIKWRRRYGVCTRYITSLAAGQSITIGLQQGYLDVQPSETAVPVLLVGPGTGLAPMRAMIHERLMWAKQQEIRKPGSRLAGDVLIFGCRSETADYYFHSEWDHLIKEEALTVLTAFSRDKDKPRQYVQDKIREAAERVVEILVKEGGKVYVCGSSGNMPKGVREALVDVLAEEGGMRREEAEGYLEAMEREGRYKQETW